MLRPSSKSLAEARAQGFALRDRDFGGDFDEGRSIADDGRDSLAVAIRLGHHVPGTINITWSQKVHRRELAVALLAGPAVAAAAEIARRMIRTTVSPDEISGDMD